MRSRPVCDIALAIHHSVTGSHSSVANIAGWNDVRKFWISSDSFSFFISISSFSADILEILDFIISDLTWFFSISDEVLSKASANMLWKLKRQSWLILSLTTEQQLM